MKTLLLPTVLAASLLAAPDSFATPTAPNSHAAMPGETVALRGYGKVTARFGPNRAEFSCESPQLADVLLGKMLADAFWDAGAAHAQKRVVLNGHALQMHVWPPYGALVAARVGSHVLVVGGDTEAQTVQAAGREPSLRAPNVAFAPAKAYPRFLDFFDLRAITPYTHAMKSAYNLGLDTHWAFLQKFGLGGIAFQQPGTAFQNPAPGVVDWAPADYEVREAEAHDGVSIPCLGAGGEGTLWMRNLFPDSIMRPSPTSLIGAWGGASTAGTADLSWAMPRAQMEATSLRFLREAMTRYKDSPAVGGWEIYAGAPGAEMGLHDRTGEYWDYSPTAQTDLRAYLRDERGLSLAQLGSRWHGDARFYKSWNEVVLPDGNEFFGDLEPQSLLLRDGWQRAPDNGESAPPTSETAWANAPMPPSQEQDFLPWGAAFYRVAFDPGAWLGQNARREAYLVCDPDNRGPHRAVQVWLNGEDLGSFEPKSAQSGGAIGLKVTQLLRSGVNTLALRVPNGGNPNSEGKLLGPVFLTATEPRAYPYLGRPSNARYLDVREWRASRVARFHASTYEAARDIDSERPLNLAAGDLSLYDYESELGAKFGASVEQTGREAFYFPWYARLGDTAGFYGASEPSATVLGSGLDRMFGWAMQDADAHHFLFWTLEDYIRDEQTSGWFTRHKQLLRLFGKYRPVPAPITVLFSPKTLRVGDDAPWSWDIGRGELQAAHYDHAYATEREVEKGLVHSPVLFDAGTEFMDAPLVAAIERYVRAGGTFVALHNTGRHEFLQPDASPVSRVTGFRAGAEGKHGTIRFEDKLPFLKAWAGRAFEGEGTSLDYLGHDAAGGANVGLQSLTRDAVPLARWEDGSIAVGYRALGKGRVLTLGSTFWRSGKDVSGVWRSSGEVEAAFFQQLFSDVGIVRDASSSSSDVWTRRAVTKNGLQEWLLAFNGAGTTTHADLSFRVEHAPSQVWDAETGETVAFSVENGMVQLKDVEFASQQTRVFAVRRANLAGGVPVWWAEKVRYWKRVAASPQAVTHSADRATNAPTTIAFNAWKFFADKENVLGASSDWMSASFNDAKWTNLRTGPWNLQRAELRDYRGTGFYRASFTLPASWPRQRVNLNLYSFDTPIVYDRGEFFLNGHKVCDYAARGWSQTLNYDVTPFLQPGQNVLSIRVQGAAKPDVGAFSGVAGVIWLEPERELASSLDLGGAWQANRDDGRTHETVTLPGTARAQFLARDFEAPAGYKGHGVFLELQGASQSISSIIVNGHPISYNSYGHPFGTRAQINVSPYLRFGATNHIELWPYATLPGNGSAPNSKDGEMNLSHLALGIEHAPTHAAMPATLRADETRVPVAPVVAWVEPGGAASAESANLIQNGDFETWHDTNGNAVSASMPTGFESGSSAYEQGADPKFALQGAIARDEAVKHGGAASLRIQNGLPTDITDARLGPFAVEPNTSYRVRVWIKTDGVTLNVKDGAGVGIWTNTGPAQDFRQHQTALFSQPSPHDGTSDWKPFEVRLQTAPDVGMMTIVLQLRRATGRVWFDDLELVRAGRVRRVESY